MTIDLYAIERAAREAAPGWDLTIGRMTKGQVKAADAFAAIANPAIVLAMCKELCDLRDGDIAAPIPMILTCPCCRFRHIDAPEPERGWMNPPHKSHLCHGCGCIWRPADVPTNGVSEIATRGSDDTWRPLPAPDACDDHG